MTAILSAQFPHQDVESQPSTIPARQDEIFVCRQPIYNQQLTVVAYNVLLHPNVAQSAQGYVVTSQMLEHAFIDIGLDAIVGQMRACIRLTRGFLLLDYATVLPPERVILEVASDTPADAELFAAIRALARQGYTMALPDILAHEHLHALVDVPEIITIDILAHPHAVIEDHITQLRAYGVKVLVRQVDTPDDFAFCRRLSVDYVQGYFFCQPDVVKGRRMPANRLTIMQLLGKLVHPKTEFDELEAMIRCDVALSYKLLRLINSSFFGLSRNITSIRQALLLLGMKQVTTWVSLMLLAGVDDKPHELTVTAMIRARLCELLAQAMHQKGTESFFLVGLFSMLDALMDRPLSDLLTTLPLVEDIRNALLHHEGPYGSTLRVVFAYERGDWVTVQTLGLDGGVINDAYLQALVWSREWGAMV